jgi:hypothetical protein
MSLFTITFESSTDSDAADAATPSAPAPSQRTPTSTISYSDEYSDDAIPRISAPQPPSKPRPPAAPSPWQAPTSSISSPADSSATFSSPRPPRLPSPASPGPKPELKPEPTRNNAAYCPQQPVPLNIFKIVRDQKGGLAKHAKFTMVREDQAILCAKVKDKKCVPIGVGAEFHYSTTQQIAVLKMSNKRKQAVLSTLEGKDVLAITFTLQEGPNKRGPRGADLKFFEMIEGVPPEMSNRRAQKSQDGWLINLSGRYAQVSVKNCVIVDEDDKEFFIARKVSRDVLIVEAHPAIPDQCTFAFGLSQFLVRI